MQDWMDCPEASGPMSENTPGGLDTQALSEHRYRLPQLDQAALAQGLYVPRRGPDPYRPTPEQTARERDLAARKFEIREAAERAAIAAGQSALEAATTASRIIREAAETADRVANR